MYFRKERKGQRNLQLKQSKFSLLHLYFVLEKKIDQIISELQLLLKSSLLEPVVYYTKKKKR